MFFRGDSPHQLTRDDLAVIGELGLRTVIDLRSREEINTLGEEPLRSLGVLTVHVPLRHAPGEAQVLRLDNEGTARTPPTLASLYRGFLRHSGPELAQIVELAADGARRPLLFHCLAGKDRTGIVAAVLLSLLGVADESIAADYAATAPILPRLRELTKGDRERLGLRDFAKIYPGLMGAEAATMLTFLQAVREEYDGVENYLAAYGVTAQVGDRLRADLLIR
ncbi:MAG: tyrosine-protein phosphatase [Pseudonocardiales bacterium]|nr:tyrosine-protein phosphatase [Pseudonocardiales bacterium]